MRIHVGACSRSQGEPDEAFTIKVRGSYEVAELFFVVERPDENILMG